MSELRKAETRYIKAHRAVVNSFNPTDDQYAELDAAGAELIVLQLAEKPRRKMKNMYDPKKTYWNLAANRQITGKKANQLLKSATSKTQEAFILLTIVPQRTKKLIRK